MSTTLRTAAQSALPPALASVGKALTIPPIHVDHVAEAICKAMLDPEVRGVVGVRQMRELIGWSEKNEEHTTRVPSSV